MPSKRYARESLLGILIGSSAAGIGLAFGRDIYKSGKQNLFVVLIAAVAIAGTAYGVWNMSRGHERGPLGTFFVTFLANAALVFLGVAVFAFVVIGFAGHEKGEPDNTPELLGIIFLTQIIFAFIGLAIGLLQRRRRIKAFAVAAANESFLINSGFREVGGRETVMLDPAGNELTLDDTRLDAILFKVKGRRGVRARIILDTDGRMLSYVPV